MGSGTSHFRPRSTSRLAYETILYDAADSGVATITLNQPDTRNALSNELLGELIDAFDRGDARLERARALADLGAMLRRRNRRTEARELLRVALDSAHRGGAGPLAAYAETELRATGARPRRIVLTGTDSLTASERRIAELASQGLTNREIAQTLFVTVRTVEEHLSHAYAKLGIRSRAQLARRLKV